MKRQPGFPHVCHTPAPTTVLSEVYLSEDAYFDVGRLPFMAAVFGTGVSASPLIRALNALIDSTEKTKESG